MEDPAVIALHNEGIYSHSQPMYETDDNAVDYLEEFQRAVTNSQKKAKNSHSKIQLIKLLIDIKLDILPLELNILPLELNLEISCLTFLTLELVKVTMSRKVTDKTKHEMVYMLWRECIPSEFYRYICEEKNFLYLNGRDVGQPTVLEVVSDFIDQGKQNL